MSRREIPQQSYHYVVGINGDMWSSNVDYYRDNEGVIIRDNYVRIPYINNIKCVISANINRIIYLTNDGELMSWISVIESDIKTAFLTKTDDYDEFCIIILYNSGKLMAVNLDEYNTTINHRLIADNVNYVYPMSIGSYIIGVQRIDSFLMELSDNSYVVIRYLNKDRLLVNHLKVGRPILVKKGIVMTSTSLYLFGIIAGRIGSYQRRILPGVKDCINYTSPAGKRTILFIFNNGNLSDHNGRLIGRGYDRFIHFEHTRGVTVIGNDQKTYEVNVHVWDSLIDKDIPVVIS